VRTKTLAQSDKILNVAGRLFATHRFHEARMEDIAAAAGVGKGTLYRYFKDKEELYTALLERATDQMVERLHEAAKIGDGPVGKLEALVETFLAFHEEYPHVFDLLQHAEALSGPDQYFPWQKARSLSIELVKKVFDEGQAQGVFHFTELNTAMMLLLGGIRGIIRFGDKPRPPNLAREVVQTFLYGVVRPGPCPNSAGKNGHGKKRAASARRG
jgi:TetR/AcrR family fatty acid metabolism transcriptional regulator